MAVVEKLAESLARNRWLLLFRGIAAILFGMLALRQPGRSLASYLLLFGAFTLADGIVGAWTAMAHRQDGESRWMLVIGSLLGVGIVFVVLAFKAKAAAGRMIEARLS